MDSIRKSVGQIGKENPTVNKRNHQRQVGLIESTANGRDALCPKAKLVAGRSEVESRKNDQRQKGLAELTTVDGGTQCHQRRAAPKLL